MLTLIDDILDLSKIEASELKLNYQEFALESLDAKFTRYFCSPSPRERH